MTRALRNSLLAAGVLVVAYPALAWGLGLMVQSRWQLREQQALERVPYLTLLRRDYRRGIYASSEEAVYALRGPFRKALQSLPGSTLWGDGRITVRNTIHHGPLPQLRAFAPATVETQLILPPPLAQRLTAALGKQAGLSFHTRMQWLGGSLTQLHSPAFQQHSAALTLRSGGLDGQVELGRQIGDEHMTLAAPAIAASGAKGSIALEDLRMELTMKPYLEALSVGDLRAAVARVALEDPGRSRSVSLQDLSLTSHSAAQGDYLDMAGRFAAARLESSSFAATQLVYEFRFAHIHGPALQSLTRALQAAQLAGGDRPDPAALQAALRKDGIELLLHDPVVAIPRIGLTLPEGSAQLSFEATLPGLRRSDLEGTAQAFGAALSSHLKATAEMRIDTDLLDRFLDSSNRAEALTAQLQSLQRQGYLKLDGKALTTHLTFVNGQLRLNGLPFPPTAHP